MLCGERNADFLWKEEPLRKFHRRVVLALNTDIVSGDVQKGLPLKATSSNQLLAREDPTSDARLPASTPRSGRREHVGNEGRRGFSGVNPLNPSGK